MTKIEFKWLKEEVISLLQKGLKDTYYYHSLDHTLDVMKQAEIIGKKENCGEDDLLLLSIAALFHDTGFVNGIVDHEAESCAIAKEILPRYGVKKKEINKVCRMITSTKVPQKPKNKLSEILCDADLDYLGRYDYQEISEKLFKEFKALKYLDDRNQWNYLQIKFFRIHSFHTKTSIKLRKPQKMKHLSELEKLVKQS